jgi:hypothetical protein
MSSRLLVVFLAAVLPSGCTLPELRELGCGDSVLSEGEDCDGRFVMEGGTCGAVGTPNECLYVCTENANCPEGWRCGIEDRCYQPQPKFVELMPLDPLPGFAAAVNDVDGDGVGDIVASDGVSLSVRFGGDPNESSSAFGLDLSSEIAAPWFGRLDDDLLADVVIPVQRALLAFAGAPTREYIPKLYSRARESVEFAAGALLDADGDLLSDVLVLTETATGSSMRFRDVACDPVPLPGGQSVSAIASPLRVGAVAPEKQLSRADLDGDGITEFALAFAGSRTLYLYSSAGSADSDDPATCLRPVPYGPAPEIAVPEGQVLADSNVLLVDVDGDTDLDVLMALALFPDDLPIDIRIPLIPDSVWVAHAVDGGGFEPATELPELTDVVRVTAGGPLAAGDVDGNGLVDYVLTGGIYLTMPPAGTEPFPRLVPVATPRGNGWDEAAVVDLNSDGFLDVLAISRQQRGIDWFVNAGTVGLPGRFNRYIVDTAFPTAHLSTGDFNGDFATDVAVVEVNSDRALDDLTVVLGIGSGLPGQAKPNGSLGKTIWFMEAGVLPDVSRVDSEIDGISDLVLMSSLEPVDTAAPTTQDARFYDLLGSTAQRLLSPLYVFDAADESDGPRVALVATAGYFLGTVDADGVNRGRGVVVASIPARIADGQPGEIDASLALLSSTADGDLQRSTVSEEIIGQLSAYMPSCMRWLVGDIDGATGAPGAEELVVIEGSRECDRVQGGPALSIWMIDFSASPEPVVRRIELPSQYLTVTAAELVDLDADGGQDLMLVAVSDSETPGATAPISEVLILWNDVTCATPPFCVQSSSNLPAHDLRENDTELWPSPVDAAPMQLDGDRHIEIAVLYGRNYAQDANELTAVVVFGSDVETPREYLEIVVDSDGDGELEPVIDLGSRVIQRITAGDVNGDGLDDLVRDELLTTRVHLQVPAEPLGTRLRRDEEAGQ